MDRNDTMLKKEYGKTLKPIMFSVLGGTVNTMIDSMFVSQRLGTDGLASINMCLPLFLLFCTIGSLLAGGACMISANQMGDGKLEESRHCYQTAIALCAVISIVVTVAGPLCTRALAAFLSQGTSLESYVSTYCLISFLGAIPTILIYFPVYYLQLEGKLRSITVMMGMMIVVDVFLDWLFLFVFHFGIAGAAWASVISLLLAFGYGMFMLEHGFSNFHFSWKEVTWDGIPEIIGYGSPLAMGNLLDVVKMIFVNMIILAAGGKQAMAVWAVLNALRELSLCIIGGVPQAAAPMMGVYYTARENSGIRILMQLQAKTGLFLCSIFSAFLIFGHRLIEQIFNMQGSILIALICLCSSLLVELFCSIWGSYFNVIGKLMLSNVFRFQRTLLFPVLTVWGLSFLGGDWIWLFLPAGGLITMLVMYLLIKKMMVRDKQTERELSHILLLDDELEEAEKVLDFSIEPTEESICKASEQISEFCINNQMDGKQTNRIRLAIEELLMVIKEKNPKIISVDLRTFVLEDTVGIRVRCAGERYNPFQENEEDEDFYLGITMLKKMAKDISYSYTLGLNTLNLFF